jgi:hypothetical protein
VPKLKLKVVHPTNGSDIMIEADSGVTIGEVVFELVQNNFLAGSLAYSVVIGKDPDAPPVADQNKSMKELGISDGATLTIRVAPSAVPAQPPAPAKKQVKPQKKKPDAGVPAPLGDEKAPAPKNEDATTRILEEYARVLTENAQWTKRHELEYRNYLDERTRLENKLKTCERKSGEMKIAAIVLTGAQVVTVLGAAFVGVNALPSIFTIAAGVLMTATGLWLSFRKSR